MANSKYNLKQTMHGMSRTPEYRARIRMITRCYNPNTPRYHMYGGRGITVCERWLNSFEAFYEDVGPQPSPAHWLERIDNHEGYEPGNVKWAERLEQMRNTRRNRYITFNGETLCISEWAERIDIGHAALMKRINRWGVERALTTPKQARYRS